MFSVIVPLYNKELSINNTVESILNQTYQNFEIIIINDGSTDNSAKVAESFKDNRIKVLHQQNQGVSAARNRGVDAAQYEWIAFLDGDDLWEKEHLNEILLMMEEYPNEKIYVTSFKYSDGRKLFRQKKRKEVVFKIDNYFKEALIDTLICTNTIVIKKQAFTKVKGFDTRLSHGEDINLWSKLGKNYNIIKSLRVTSTYRVDAENRSTIGNDMEKNHVYHLDMTLPKNSSEFIYNKRLILDRLYIYILRGKFKSFLRLKRRFDQAVSYSDVIRFTRKTLKNRLIHKLKN